MSRGGRGGGGWGRQRMGNVELPWDYDPSLKIDYTPSDDYPPIARPAVQKPPRNAERRQVAYYRRMRSHIHEGPLYTVLSANSGRVDKHAPLSTPVRDVFESMPSYTQKYMKQRRSIPRLDGRMFVTRFFPEELRALLDPGHGKATDALHMGKEKTAQVMRSKTLTQLEAGLFEDGDEQRPNQGEAAGDGPSQKRDESEELDEDRPGEPQDDDFAEDEEDMDDDNDYNAEKYFDDGEDEHGGDEDWGGGGGGEDWGD